MIFRYFLLAVCFIAKVDSKLDCSHLQGRLKETASTAGDGKDDNLEKTIKNVYDYPKAIEILVNHHINKEMELFYHYLDMYSFFLQEDHDLPGFSKYFHSIAENSLKKANSFIQYQSRRGGRLELFQIQPPTKKKWKTPGHAKFALKESLDLEKNMTDETLCLHDYTSEKYSDQDFLDFLETSHIPQQYATMKRLKSQYDTLSRMEGLNEVSVGLAEFQFDLELQREYK